MNEEGTEAAAATAVAMVDSMARFEIPKVVKADHPFIILIKDKETENILHNPDHFKESLLSYIKELQEEQRKQYNSATQTFIKSKIAKFPAPHQEHHG